MGKNLSLIAATMQKVELRGEKIKEIGLKIQNIILNYGLIDDDTTMMTLFNFINAYGEKKYTMSSDQSKDRLMYKTQLKTRNNLFLEKLIAKMIIKSDHFNHPDMRAV